MKKNAPAKAAATVKSTTTAKKAPAKAVAKPAPKLPAPSKASAKAAKAPAKPAAKPVTLLVLGAGGRGFAYANLAKKMPNLVKVVAVAEPRDFHREKFATENGIAPEKTFKNWKDAAASKTPLADAVAICTQDAMHEACVMAFAKQGYHILLEKPMAPTAAACRRIVAEVKKYGKMFAVCHVMRYTQYTQALKKMIVDGAVGDIVSIEHSEPVGFWHQAHSFVRGNWRNEAESSFMLLAKSCHDVDWLSYIVDKPCVRVSSFGGLYYFNAAHQPKGAADRCMDCKLSPKCPYSAKRFYFDRLSRKEDWGWPLDVVDPTFKKANLAKALREGPYGRCVFKCDNDVVDHQVVNFEYEGGVTATFTMNAFNPGGGRKTRIFGTTGYIESTDSSTIRHYDYLTKKWKEIDTAATDRSMAGGHGGGDGGILGDFCLAIQKNDPSLIITGADATLESHLTTFAAEKARKTGKVVEMATFK